MTKRSNGRRNGAAPKRKGVVSDMRIVFMGTPDYAASSLEALAASGHEITAVVTQPDKPKGRKGEPVPPPVKVCAVKHGIPVLQPARVKRPEAVEELRAFPADVYVVAAFGQILSREILEIPPLGCLNIHASLLPKYRGASPIQHAIIDGEERTGITIMQMDAGIDTGDILYQKEIEISAQDTYETLHDKLTALGGEAIVEALNLLEQGKLFPRKQDESLSCYAPLIGKEMGKIDFGQEAIAIDRKIRGMTPWPSAFTSYKGRQLKIWRAVPDSAETEINVGHVPGEIVSLDKDSMTVATGKGVLRVYELQIEGKRRMAAHDFLLGVRMQIGEVLGT